MFLKYTLCWKQCDTTITAYICIHIEIGCSLLCDIHRGKTKKITVPNHSQHNSWVYKHKTNLNINESRKKIKPNNIFWGSLLHLLFTLLCFCVPQYGDLRGSKSLAGKAADFWTVMLLKPREALALSACGTVTASLAAHKSMNAKRNTTSKGPLEYC